MADPAAVKLLLDEGPRRWRAAGRRPKKTEEEAGVGGAPAMACGGGGRRRRQTLTRGIGSDFWDGKGG